MSSTQDCNLNKTHKTRSVKFGIQVFLGNFCFVLFKIHYSEINIYILANFVDIIGNEKFGNSILIFMITVSLKAPLITINE